MSYVHKIIGADEQLIGIARLHWIYIIIGTLWFFALSGLGWLINQIAVRALLFISSSTNYMIMPEALMGLSYGLMQCMMGLGLLIFLMYVVKVMATSIALTNRRVIYKTGLIFVNARNIDIEEIRGENLDLGYFGRLLGYGAIHLDCRFIGDVKLPYIENPERFLRALHKNRAEAQDSLRVVLGKSGSATTLNIVSEDEERGAHIPQQPKPDIEQLIEQPVAHHDIPGQNQIGRTDEIVAPPSLEQIRAQAYEAAQAKPIDSAVIAQVVEQVTPQIAQQVVKQMAEQGLIPTADKDGDAPQDDLAQAFDDASLDDGNKPAHAIH